MAQNWTKREMYAPGNVCRCYACGGAEGRHLHDGDVTDQHSVGAGRTGLPFPCGSRWRSSSLWRGTIPRGGGGLKYRNTRGMVTSVSAHRRPPSSARHPATVRNLQMAGLEIFPPLQSNVGTPTITLDAAKIASRQRKASEMKAPVERWRGGETCRREEDVQGEPHAQCAQPAARMKHGT